MTSGMVTTFDCLEDAEAARQALLAAGFTAEQVQLVVREDEAGPAKSNFVSGNGRDETGRVGGFLRGLLGQEDRDHYDANFAPEAPCGGHLLTVVRATPRDLERAVELVRPFGGVDVNARTAKAAGPASR